MIWISEPTVCKTVHIGDYSASISIMNNTMNTLNKQTEVFQAVKEDDSTSLDKLLKSKDLETLDFAHGCSPLTYAVEIRHYQIAKQLLCAGANVDFMDNYGRTPLTVAVRSGNLDMCHLFISYHVNVNAIGTAHRTTALGVAALWDRCEIASLLLDNGAIPCDPTLDLTQVDPMGAFSNSPIACACESSVNVLKLLLNHCKKTNQNLPLEVMFNLSMKARHGSGAILMLKEGYYPHVKSGDPPRSLLYNAAYYGCVKLMSFIVEINPHFLQEAWLIKKNFPALLKCKPTYKYWLVEYRKQVPSLQKLCKSAILSQLDTYYRPKTDELPLPKVLKKYLCALQPAYNHG